MVQTPARQFIDAQGRRIEWLAKQIGVERTYLTRMVNGQRPMPVDVARRLAPLLGVSVAHLLPEEAENERVPA